MELNWNKTPDGRRFIHTAQIVPGFEWKIVLHDKDGYTLAMNEFGPECSFYDTLKQAKAAAKRMTMDHTWTRLASDQQAALIALHGTQEIVDMYAANEKADMFGDVNAAPRYGMLNDDAESVKVGVLPVLDTSDIDFSGPPKAIDGQHLHARIATLGSTYGTLEGLPPGSIVERADHMPYSDHMRVTFKLPVPDAGLNTHVTKVMPRKIDEVLKEIEKAAQILREKSGMSHITAVCGPTISDMIRQGYLQQYRAPAWAWPRAGQYVEHDIVCAVLVANHKRTHAKQTGNARVLVSRNKREGRYVDRRTAWVDWFESRRWPHRGAA